MIIVNGLLAGTITLAATRIVWRRRQRNLMYWLVADESGPFESEDPQALRRIDDKINTTYRLASYSLGLSILGTVYTPFGWLSVPLTLASALPLFERTLDNAVDRFSINSDVFASTVISVSLILENYFFASLLQWLYALNERAAFKLSEQMRRYFDPNRVNVDWGRFFDQFQVQWRANGDTITLDPNRVRNTRDDADDKQ